MKTLLSALVSLVFVALVNAHFQIAFPPPRGSFVAAEEPTFCGMISTQSFLFLDGSCSQRLP